MKFIHFADMHLGAEPDKGYPWAAARKERIWETFGEIIDACRREKPDLLLVAGDLFHREPLVRELKEVDSHFASLAGTRVVIIAGNHDHISGISHYNGFEWSENVTFFRAEEPQSIYFEDISTEVYGLSFCHRQIHEPLLTGIRPAHPDRINILLMHGGDPNSLPVDRAELTEAGFDYIACGHIHTPLVVSERMIYPGCPEPLERNDTGERGFVRGSIEKAVSRGENGPYTADDHGTERGCSRQEEPAASRIETEFVPCGGDRYYREELEAEADVTNYLLGEMIRDRIAERGGDGIFSFTVTGRRDPDISFDIPALMKEGRIVEIVDRTEPDYDYDRLLAENRGNIIGRYIEKIRAEIPEGELRQKALAYGIFALFKGQT